MGSAPGRQTISDSLLGGAKPLRILPLPPGGTDVPPHPPWAVGSNHPPKPMKIAAGMNYMNPCRNFLERAMGFEPTALGLGSRCSTAELRPLDLTPIILRDWGPGTGYRFLAFDAFSGSEPA